MRDLRHRVAFAPVLILAASASAVHVVPTTRLANGVEMPRVVLGMGPWCNDADRCPAPKPPCRDCYNDSAAAADVQLAFSVGFDGIDDALGYSNQVGVGQAIQAYQRSSVWVATKVPACHSSMTVEQCRNQTLADFAANLQQLNTSYVDLMLLHSPPATGPGTACSGQQLCDLARAQWQALIDRYSAGAARAIGVSNYCHTCFDCLQGMSPVPHVNQVQYHAGMPGADPAGIVSDCQRRGVVVQAYSPLGNYRNHSLLHANITNEIAAAHNKSAAQVGLRWVIQNNLTLAVAAAKRSYLVEDLDVFGWSLTPDEMLRLDSVPFAPEDPTRGVCK